MAEYRRKDKDTICNMIVSHAADIMEAKIEYNGYLIEQYIERDPEKVVVTGPRRRVDDDLRRIEKGFGGALQPATMRARSFVSSTGSSSSRRSRMGSACSSSAPSSSRMPSRAATE